MRNESLILTREEEKLAKQIAERKGISVQQAATLVVQAAIARRIRKRTGKGPAKVYQIRK